MQRFATTRVRLQQSAPVRAKAEPWIEPNNWSNTLGHVDRHGRGASLCRYGIVRSGPAGCAAARVGVWRDRSRVTPLGGRNRLLRAEQTQRAQTNRQRYVSVVRQEGRLDRRWFCRSEV